MSVNEVSTCHCGKICPQGYCMYHGYIYGDPFGSQISEKDIRVEVYRTGPVNKPQCYVRVTHIPTGLVTTNSDDNSELQNRKWALLKLYDKLGKLEWTIK